jgi:hypothetical protein
MRTAFSTGAQYRPILLLAVAVAFMAVSCAGGAPSPSGLVGHSLSAAPTLPLLIGDNLAPGTYAIASGTLKATITVPAGWNSLDLRGVSKGGGDTFIAVLFWPFPDDFKEVYSNPCHWKTSAIVPPVGPTVDDLANALAAQEMRGDALPTEVTIGGFSGKLVEMSVPTDIDFADCDDGYFYSWAGRYHQGPGQIDDVYILDVNGERQVLIAHHMPGVSAADLAEQQAILDSIDIEG